MGVRSMPSTSITCFGTSFSIKDEGFLVTNLPGPIICQGTAWWHIQFGISLHWYLEKMVSKHNVTPSTSDFFSVIACLTEIISLELHICFKIIPHSIGVNCEYQPRRWGLSVISKKRPSHTPSLMSVARELGVLRVKLRKAEREVSWVMNRKLLTLPGDSRRSGCVTDAN